MTITEFVKFEKWLRRVKFYAVKSGLLFGDVKYFDKQKCWFNYFSDDFSPKEAWNIELSYS